MKLLLLMTTLITLSFSSTILALEMDEKLTMRILNVSQAKKTILINRGLEDGLVVGDHAKFFLTTGVIARGVVVKAAPTRTVWSLYRVVDGDKVLKDQVLKLKISSPMRVTVDNSKMLSDEDLGELDSESMEESRRVTVNSKEFTGEEEEADLATMNQVNVVDHSSSVRPRFGLWEVWGSLHMSSMSTTTDSGYGESPAVRSTGINFSLGVEKYFKDARKEWGRKMSGILFVNIDNFTTSSEGESGGTSVIEFGVGGHWHFLGNPFETEKHLLFLGGSLGLGRSSMTASSTESQSGLSNFFSLGGGVKYLSKTGFGYRLMLDYFRRGATYEDDRVADGKTSIVSSGPRALLGLSYRW